MSVLTCPQGHTLGDISDWAIKKLLKLGFTDMDIEMLERLGVTDADARQIIEAAKVPNTGNGPTHFIPAYDLMYYVNDVNRENTEVLTLGSRYNSDTSFVYGQQRLYADHEGESETYLYDGRGSVVQLLKDGAVTQEYAYDAYGYINADEFGIQAPFYGYNGEEQNPFTGLQYLRARYYAPQNGGFITQDSFSGVLTNALSQNRYAYAHNNPVNYADPSGHSIWDSIKNGVTNAVNSVKNFVSNVANKVSSAVSSAVNAVKSAVTGTTTKTVANTSSAVKKSYTNTAVRQKIGSYAGGAAAAAAGSVTTRYSNSVVNGVIADSRIPFTNAAGQTVMLPNHFSDMQAAAQAFTKRGCDESLSKISKQQKFSFWDNLINTLEQSINIKSQNQMYSDKANRELLLAFGDTIASSFAAQGNSYVKDAYSQQEIAKEFIRETVIPALYKMKETSKDYTGVATIGASGSITAGIWSVEYAIAVVGDNRGNFEIQSTYGFNGTTGVGFSASVNVTGAVLNAPDVSSLHDTGYKIGGSIYDIFGGGADVLIVPGEDTNYFGISGQYGAGMGGELHAGWGETSKVSSINIYDFLIGILEEATQT